MFEPVVGIVAASLLLGSRLTAPQLIGGVVVLAGALLAVTATQRSAPAPVETSTTPTPTV